MKNFGALSPAHDDNFFVSTNLGFKAASLEDNSSGDNSVESYNGPSHFHPYSAIIILAVLTLLFSIGFSFIFIWRRSTNRDGSTASRSRGGEATQALERKVIESFPVFTYSMVKGLKIHVMGSECAVCLSDFEDEERVRLLPKCSHAFHPECIDVRLCSHTTCQVCWPSLLPADDSNPTTTNFVVFETQTPPQQVAIVIDNGDISRDTSNEEAASGALKASHVSTGAE